MISILIHGAATGLFLLLAYLYPRYPVSGWLQKDSWINVVTGLGVFLFAKPVYFFQTLFFDLVSTLSKA